MAEPNKDPEIYVVDPDVYYKYKNIYDYTSTLNGKISEIQGALTNLQISFNKEKGICEKMTINGNMICKREIKELEEGIADLSTYLSNLNSECSDEHTNAARYVEGKKPGY